MTDAGKIDGSDTMASTAESHVPLKPVARLSPRRIAAAAIKLDGFIAMVEQPRRHHDIINNLAATGFPTPIGGVQGFVTTDGLFVDRRTAMGIARAAEQIIPREGQHGSGGDLFSEDLW